MSTGNYRRVYEVLIDHPRFTPLHPDARAVWLALKLKLGPAGIGPVYDEQLIDWSGVEGPDRLRRARQDLIDHGWLEIDGRIHWLIGGFANEPARKSPNGVKAVNRMLGSMRAGIVDRFQEHYAEYLNPSPKGSGKGSSKGSGKGLAKGGNTKTLTKTKTKTKTLTKTKARAPDPDFQSGSPEGQQRDPVAWADAKAKTAQIRAESGGGPGTKPDPNGAALPAPPRKAHHPKLQAAAAAERERQRRALSRRAMEEA